MPLQQWAGKQGWELAAGLGTTTSPVAACDYCVAYIPLRVGFCWNVSTNSSTHTGLIGYGANSASTNGMIQLGAATANKTFNDCFAVAGVVPGVYVNSSQNITFNRLYVNACINTGATGVGGVFVQNAARVFFNNSEINANRTDGIGINSSVDVNFDTCEIGSKGTNAIDVLLTSSTYNSALFNNCNFGSATLVSNYANTANGTLIRFHKHNQTNNNHLWYTNYGTARSTGAGLADTTVRTPGSLGVRMAPENNTTGFDWSFLIPAKANSIVSFFGYFQKNAAFGTSTAKVEIFLPGSLVADATSTLSNVTGSWQSVSLSVNNTLTVDGYATVKITGITNTASAYLYADDFYNAGDTVTSTDKVTGLDTWYQGLPSPIIQSTATSAADIWTFSTSGLTTANTTGKKLVDGLTTGKFLGLK